LDGLDIGVDVLQSSLKISLRLGGDFADTGVSGGERNCSAAGDDEMNMDNDPEDEGRLTCPFGIFNFSSFSRDVDGGVTGVLYSVFSFKSSIDEEAGEVLL
jgi:hypothetical protein